MTGPDLIVAGIVITLLAAVLTYDTWQESKREDAEARFRRIMRRRYHDTEGET